MSNNSNNSNIMYTSTPLRKSANHSRGSYQGMQSSARRTDQREAAEPGYNQNFYSLPRASYNSTSISDNNEYKSIPADTYNSTMPELLNENELELAIESDTDDSYTNYKTPDTSYQKRNFCRPLYFQNACSSDSEENNKTNDTDTTFTDIPLNVREKYRANSSSASYTNDPSTNYSKNKKSDADHKNSGFFDVKLRREHEEYEEDESDCIAECNMPQYCRNMKSLNSNYSQEEDSKKSGKPHISMETYPNSPQYLKKNRRSPNCNVPFIKEDDYQQEIPPFVHDSDATDPSNITSLTDDKALESIYLKYSRKEDVSAKSDSINMLSVVISTVMLLASKSQIPQNYITWTLKYLKCIKNKQGQYPPNIQKIQRMLTAGSAGTTAPTGQAQTQSQGHCSNIQAGKSAGKRMDLTRK